MRAPRLLPVMVVALAAAVLSAGQPVVAADPKPNTTESKGANPLAKPLSEAERIAEDLKRKAETLGTKLRGAVKENVERLKDRIDITAPEIYPYTERPAAADQTHDFYRDVRPILDRKCVACHACYEAPCQLNLADPAGLERGASKIKVYDGTRLGDIPPTRLHVDAAGPREWRRKGFFSVLDPPPAGGDGDTAPLLLKFLQLGRAGPLAAGAPVPADMEVGLNRANSCPAPDEFTAYATNNPHGGMPLAVAGLDDAEFGVVATWLREGARLAVDPPAFSAAERAGIAAVEAWFNRTDPRARLVARYVFEHLFLAHLYVEPAGADGPPRFFRLIRATTAPGLTPEPLATVRPNEPPGGPFHYRLVPVAETIVHKTHITYRLDAARLAELDDLFLAPPWPAGKPPGYGDAVRANPFLAFRAIPAALRYRFLLNDAEFFVRNFIRGPVCNGAIATYVIRDQFWVMFEDPDAERYVNDAGYRDRVTPLLGVPGQKTSLVALGPEWVTYQKSRNRYLDIRQRAYAAADPAGPRLAHVWDGDGTNPNAFLTVFRHYTNASVTQGWQGELPLTAWLMDYPLIERTFYELVVGFDVFGSVSHQLQTRLYFDLIRNEGETNFLRLLPPDARRPLYDDWYQAGAKIKSLIVYHDLDTQTPSAIAAGPDTPMDGLLRTLMARTPALVGGADSINRCDAACAAAHPEGDPAARIAAALRPLTGRPATVVGGIRQLPDVSFLRVDLPDGGMAAYSLLRNRRHSNVAFVFGEELRRQEDLDSLTILPRLIGSYPNLIFRVPLAEVPAFAGELATAGTPAAFARLVRRWGVPRLAPDFWETFHSFADHIRTETPLEAGIHDMNRYERW